MVSVFTWLFVLPGGFTNSKKTERFFINIGKTLENYWWHSIGTCLATFSQQIHFIHSLSRSISCSKVSFNFSHLQPVPGERRIQFSKRPPRGNRMKPEVTGRELVIVLNFWFDYDYWLLNSFPILLPLNFASSCCSFWA